MNIAYVSLIISIIAVTINIGILLFLIISIRNFDKKDEMFDQEFDLLDDMENKGY